LERGPLNKAGPSFKKIRKEVLGYSPKGENTLPTQIFLLPVG